MSENPFENSKTDAKGFYDLLAKSGILLKETNKLRVTEEVFLGQVLSGVNYKIIDNVYFEEQVVLENFSILFGIGFVNCEFRKGIIFKGFVTSDYDDNFNYNNTSIYFKDCKGSTIILENVNLNRGFLIQKSEFNRIYFKGVEIGNGGITLREISVLDLIDFLGVKSIGITIAKSDINAKVRLNAINSNISFIKSTFQEWLQFYKITGSSKVVSNYCVYENTLKFEACQIQSLSLHSDEYRRQFTMKLWEPQSQSLGSLDELYCQDVKFLEGFYLEGSDESKLKKLTLPLTSGASGLLRIENLILEETKFSGLNESLKIVFRKIVFHNLNMIDFTNNSTITFNDCKGATESSLILSNVELGPTRFNHFSFQSFSCLRWSNVNLMDIVTSNVYWFTDEQLFIGINEEKNKSFYQGKREVYRQIKQALHSNGNHIESIIFKARELHSYRNELYSSKNYPISERLIMLVNKTNDYGVNWIKPVFILFLITICFYLITAPHFTHMNYALFLRNENLINTILTLCRKSDVFFQLFNPVRKFSDTYGVVSSNWMYFLDFLHRVVLGILIYQIIKAFRKYFSS